MPLEGRTALPTLLLDYRPALHNREGIGRVARELVRELAGRDDRPPLVLFGGALREPRVRADELGLAGAHAVRLRAPRLPARFAEPLFSLIGGADRIFGAGLVHHTQLRRLPARRAPSTAMVFDLLFLDGGAGRLAPSAARSMERRLRALVPHVTRVQVTSAVVRDQVAEHLALPHERIDTLPLGGDHVTRAPKVPRDDPRLPHEPYVLSVSRLDPRKGFDLALAAFERLVARGYDGRWVVVGPPGFGAADLEAALARSPAAARIERRRDTPDDELAALYRHADVFLFASRAEGFGLPPIEAMWSDCPVVSSRATCLAEIVGDGADTFDPDDDPHGDALFALVERAVSDAKHRDALRTRGARWRTRFTWKACADASLASWRAAVEGGSTR
jgi:glycosyltransferase involved in cell wall biosynthesis